MSKKKSNECRVKASNKAKPSGWKIIPLQPGPKQIVEDGLLALASSLDEELHLGEIEQAEYNEQLKEIVETAKLFGIKEDKFPISLTLDEENASTRN